MPKESSKKAKYKVLFVDDYETFLKMYSEKFEIEGFEVSVISDSRKALKMVHEFKPDIVYLDLVMGKKDGITVLKELKENLETKWIPVVMLSNIDSAEDRKRCEEYGASHYLVKVRFSPAELVEYTKKALKLV